jgi:GNAT superfamily N-acetyltransferase
MTDQELLTRMWAGLRCFYEVLASADHASVTVLDGVRAYVQPATPDRSLFNAVLYERHDALAAALPELAELYRRAGVRAWTVWTHLGDGRTARLLERSGHVLDGAPAAMALELRAPTGEGLPLELDREASLADVARLNDLAYDHAGFETALAGVPDDSMTFYVARVDDDQACCVPSLDREGDCVFFGVATLPAARGRGLATALMRHALGEAYRRGCTTSTLQATKLGEPLYARLGYRKLGNLEMWEQREARR